jgi:ferrochelatase
MRYLGQTDYDHASTHRIGVVLVNLGTPAAPDTASVRRYLREFLSDPRVVEVPRWIWKLILEGIILRFRPRRSAHAYQQVWTEQGSPLMTISRELTAAVQSRLDAARPGRYLAGLAMRYGQPAIEPVLRQLQAKGARRFVILPLYPQYSATTTGAVYDALAAAWTRWRAVPDHHFVAAYWQRPAYIEALADSVRRHWAEHGRGDKLLMSFHGIPQRYFNNGDPYHCHCHGTAARLAAALNLPASAWQLSFQSRVGREPWLQPYTDETVKALAKSGIRKLDVICPGFSVDCLETLEEIQGENAEFFVEAGGEALRYIPCLNAEPAHADLLTELALGCSAGWPEADPSFDPAAEAARRAAAYQALKAGGSAR